jgi:hypothetical protein
MADAEDATMDEQDDPRVLEPAQPNNLVVVINDIKDLYINNPGLSLDKRNPYPVDFLTLSDDEIINMYDNLRMQLHQRKRDDIIAKMVRLVVNIGDIAAHYGGYRIPQSAIDKIQQDSVLKEALAAVVLGKAFKPHPLIALALSLADSGAHAFASRLPLEENNTQNDEVVSQPAVRQRP